MTSHIKKDHQNINQEKSTPSLSLSSSNSLSNSHSLSNSLSNSSTTQRKQSIIGRSRRFSLVETEKWKEIFDSSSGNNQREEEEDHLKRVVTEGKKDFSQQDEIEINPEDEQWRELFGCRVFSRDRVVSVPIPVNPDKISGFLKRNSDPVTLPSRRVSAFDQQKWKDMFSCDAKLEDPSTLPIPTQPSQGEDENWRVFFGCQDPPSYSPRSGTPTKLLPDAQAHRHHPHPAISQPNLSTITEKDTDAGSTHSSGEIPPPKLLGYLKSKIKSKLSKKKR